MRPYHLIFKRLGGRYAAHAFLALLCGSALYAQQAGDGPGGDKETLQLLFKRSTSSKPGSSNWRPSGPRLAQPIPRLL